MANSYIELRASNETQYLKYMATEMKLPHRRMDTIEWAVDGAIDKAAGPIVHEWAYVLRVPIDTHFRADSSYGTYQDLSILFDYNDAHGTPTDVISFKDHWGDSHSVYFAGDMDPSSLTPVIGGSNAWFLVSISFVEKN